MGEIGVQQIVQSLNDVQEGLREDEISPRELTELYRVVRVLADETVKAQEEDLNV
jgi:hypothetical protein